MTDQDKTRFDQMPNESDAVYIARLERMQAEDKADTGPMDRKTLADVCRTKAANERMCAELAQTAALLLESTENADVTEMGEAMARRNSNGFGEEAAAAYRKLLEECRLLYRYVAGDKGSNINFHKNTAAMWEGFADRLDAGEDVDAGYLGPEYSWIPGQEKYRYSKNGCGIT
jgi:hypothetical protein